MILHKESRETLSLLTDWAMPSNIARQRDKTAQNIRTILRRLHAAGYVEKRSNQAPRSARGGLYHYQEYRVTLSGAAQVGQESATAVKRRGEIERGEAMRAVRAAKKPVLDPTVNAFNWKTFVQPHMINYDPHAMTNRYGELRT